MSNTARKARKKAGIQFSKPAKVGTPPYERAIPEVRKKHPLFGPGLFPSNRAMKKTVRRYGDQRSTAAAE